jgi:glycosyltransferase involved in cell wall biosynthesis
LIGTVRFDHSREQMMAEGFDGKGHVLIISQDVVGKRMAGPGVRYYNLARVLCQEFDVVLAVPRESTAGYQNEPFRVVQYEEGSWASVEPFVSRARVIFFPSDIATVFPQLAQSNVPLVVDGFDPLLAEWMALTQSRPQEQQAHWATRASNLTQQYLLGDFFVCASERQRDWWLGLLEANGRVNFWTHQEDPSLRRLVDVVPFGLPQVAPRHTRQVVKGVWPGIGEQDRVILWGGGIWPWLDPLTAIRALASIWEQRQDVRLVFPGTRRPNAVLANIPASHVEAARELANQLDLLNKGIFFGDWIPYDDWPNVLLESDVALTLHFEDTLETRLAFRSRTLDYIWAGLPVVATRGDATSELISAHQVGILVPGQDVHAVAQAILCLLDTPRQTFADRFEQIHQTLTWEHAAQPLIEFCRHPRRAPDRVAQGDQLGNPFYALKVDELQSEINRLQTLVGAYEQRRAVRLANRLHCIGKRLGWL